MEHARDELAARAVLAADQDGGITIGVFGDLVGHRTHRLTLGD
jgi:hypothetical protein